MIYNLKFTTEAEAEPVLYKEDKTPKFPNIDTIGVIYKPTGNYTVVDGMSTPEMAPIAGWHVNVNCDASAELDAYHIVVNNPVRKWA